METLIGTTNTNNRRTSTRVSFVPSQTVLFPECVRVLRREMRLVHYRDLTEIAVRNIMPVGDVDMAKTAEDVRERLLLAGMHGTSYLAKPHFCGMLTEWLYPGDSIAVMPDQHIKINHSLKASIAGGTQAAARLEYMKDKGRVGRLVHAGMAAKGLIVEEHVKSWFKLMWPGNYNDPPNSNSFRSPCAYDFSMMFGGTELTIDVAGYGLSGSMNVENKMPVDLRVIASLDESRNAVFAESWVHGSKPTQNAAQWRRMPMASLCFWFNCLRDGVSISDLRLSQHRA